MADQSSLDRFLTNRAAVGLGLSGRRAYIVQTVIGSVLTIFGLGMMLSPALLHLDPGAAAGGIGPMIAGLVNLASGQIMKRRLGNLAPNDWHLTPEAKALVLRLVRRRLGWLDGKTFAPMAPMGPFGFSGKRARRAIRHIAWENGEWGFGWLHRPPAEASPDITELLEKAAMQFNRIQGLLQAPASSLAKIGPNALRAADEAMADVFHEAAMLDKFPESGNATRKQIDQQTAAMKELADRLEELATREQTITDKVGYSSSMDAVLEELRLDQLARSELQTSNEPQQQQQRLD